MMPAGPYMACMSGTREATPGTAAPGRGHALQDLRSPRLVQVHISKRSVGNLTPPQTLGSTRGTELL